MITAPVLNCPNIYGKQIHSVPLGFIYGFNYPFNNLKQISNKIMIINNKCIEGKCENNNDLLFCQFHNDFCKKITVQGS